MIPLHDTIPSRRLPVMTWAIILTNLLVFFFQKSLLPREYFEFVNEYGLIPARVYSALELNQFLVRPFVSYMFLHGGWLHIISNLWALWLFGDNVEDRMGPCRFLLFYFCMGIIAGGVHFINNPGSTLPTIGASGAIAGVMGAYLIMYPAARILTFIPLFFIPFFVKIPAVIYLLFWFGSQFYAALSTHNSSTVSNVAWWAHVGGFGAGLLCHFIFLKPRRKRYYI